MNVAVTSGLEGASMLMDEVAAGTSPYHFIEVMGCPGGCINGGGQQDARRRITVKNVQTLSTVRMSARCCANPMRTLI